MPVNEIKRMDIDFNQKGIIFKFAEKWLDYNSNKFFIRSSDERKKMIYGGLCWGLTRYYMTHIAQNGQQNSAVFFIKFKRLIGLANREIPINASIIERYQIEAERRYANTILDKVLFDILNEHTYANSINLLQSYRIPQVKSYLRTKEDPNAVNAHKIIKRIYRNEFIKNHDLVKERWFVDIFLIAEKNFTAFDKKSIMEIQSAIEAAKIKIYKIYVDDEINYLKNRGVLYLKKSVSDINNNYYIDIDNLFSHMTNKHQNAFYEIYTGNHVVVLTVTVNPSNNEKNITFFDSNKGLYLFNDLAEAKNFIIEFSKYTSEKYQWNLEKIDNPEIHIGFFAKASDFSDKLIDLTPPKYQISSMVINKMITHGDIIQTNEDVEIKFLQLNQHNNIVTFSIEEKSNIDHGNKKIIMSTDHIDIRTIIYLVNKEQDNLFALSHQNLFTRFDKGNIQVYQLPDNFDLSANIKDIYDKLPTPAYKVVPDSTTQSYEMVSRAPRIQSNNNLNIDFDKWRPPIIQSELITNNSHQNNLSLAYERTIIIQIQSDTILDQVVSGLIAKHPEKNILLQFDIATKKRRLAYGRHEDLLSAGQTRWIVVGHGDYQGNGKVSQFAQHSPKAVANGLQWLKNDLAIKQTPNKIVLMGCELAEGTAKEDFAFNMTQLLNKNAFDADIIAYTNDLFIDSHGKRIGYINNESDESQPARIYKKTYRYHHATDSITINGKPVILSLLNDLQADKVSFERFITDNQQLLTPLFSAPSGELNIDLIKKIAYDQRAYDLFKNAINEPDYNNYEAFYNKIIDEMVNNGINEAPIWKTVDKNYINENKLNFSHNRNDKLNVIMRLTSDKENLTKAQLYAIFKPENTLIIQCDVKNNQSFIEYGDLPSLTLISNHSWTILDGNELSLLDPDTLSQSLLALRQKYPLKVPMEIKLFNDNGKIENTAIYDPQHLAARLCQKLAEKGLNSSVSISQPKSEFMSPDYELGIFLDDYHEQQKNTFQFDITTQKLMINGEPPIKALLLDIVTGKITLAEITAKNPAILLPSFADQQGKLDIKKLKQTIYDPLLSIKVNQYFAHGDYLAHDARLRWNALFIAQKSLPLSQQSAELSFLIGELQANPYAVRYLSDHSRYLLGQYFSSNNGELDTIYLMQALAHPEYVEFIQTQLQEFSGLKISKEFDGLSLKQALMKSSTWRQRVLDNIVSLTKSAQCSQSEATISAVSHGYYLHKINTNSLRIEQALGALYVIACQQGKQAQFIKILAYHQALLELSSKSDLSIQDQQFLTEFDAALSQLQDINYAPRIENQSLKSWLMQASDGAYYLQSGKHAFTVVIKRQADIFQYQLYDPKAGELVISNSKQKQAQKDFFRVFQTYLDRETRYRKENTARKVDLMIENMNGDYRFDIYELTLTHQAVEKTHLFWQFTPPKLDTNTYLVKINNIEISLPLLIRAGAQIDGQSLSVRHLQSLPDWRERLTFDAAMLSHHLMLLDASHDDAQFIKLIKSLIDQRGQDNLIATRAELADVGMIKQQLGYVDRYVKGEVIDAAMWHEMKNTTFKLPRYARIMSKVGYGSQAIGIAQLWILTNRAADQLQDPRLCDEQKAEIRRQLALAYGAAAANFGTDILQPIIFKSVTKITDSTEIAAKFAGRATAVLNALSAGFDIYNAYQSFHQLSTETDPEVRQDLIVNGTLAVVSAAVSIAVSVALLAGFSAAGPIGIAVGAGLMVGGIIYNGIRAVERIEEKVKLTGWEEFATGISAAFGEQPPTSVLNKLQAYNEEEGYEKSLLQRIKNQISIFRTEGYGRALYVKESYQMAEVPLFNIRDISSGLCLTTKEQAKALTLEKLNGSKIQVSAHEQATENYNYLDMSLLEGTVGYKSLGNSFFTFPKYRFTEDQLSRITTAYPDKYAAESVVIKNYAPVMSSTSNEIFIFDPERKDLDFYLAGKKIESIYSYIEKNTQFIYLTDKGEVKTIPFDRNQLLHQLSVAGENAGIIFNTANGNDTIVGFKQYKNRFEIYNGNKIFVGGEKNDTFVLKFDAHYPNESRYLDGYAGSNSIIIHQLPVIKSNSAVNTEKNSTNLLGIDKDNFTRQVGVLVNLKQEKIWMIDDHQYVVNNYDNEKFSSFMRTQRLATIKNMENVTVVANSADIIVGDARDNVLDGNLGNDRLYGGKGNDTLILTQGIADGGEGHDVYRIKRYNWQDHIEIFADDNLKYQRWDPIKGAFVFADNSNSEEIASSTNPKFRFNNGYSYNALIVIDDSHQNINQQSMVYLDYDINEIKSVFKSGNDIVIEVEIINNAKFFKNNIISNISIRLKNVYAQDEKGNYFTNHEYNVKCQNSFLLSPILLAKADKNKNPTEYFKAAYVRPKYRNERNVYTNDVEVNFAQNSFKVFSKDIYEMPAGIKVMAKFLASDGMTIIGDNDDQIIALAAQYYIYVSKGNDFYLIKSMALKNLPDVDTTFNLNEDIIFDFSKVKNTFDSNDKIIIAIQEYSGYDFEFDGDRLIHKDKVGKIVNIVFKNLPKKEIKNVIVQDKYQQLFMMALKKGENKIVPMIAIKEPTSGHDIIELPVGYRLNENRLDAMAGNDIITDLSGRDNIINAGSGDDMVTVIKGNNIIDAGPGDDIVATAKGNNIILPGEGNDIVNSGIGDDTIITTNGNDEINCGKGNNAIFINHQVGHITINCAGGSDTIYIQNFDHYFSDGNIRYYIADNQQDYFIKSKDKKSSITIKNAVANDDKVKIYRGINNGNYLDSDNINILIDKLSAFNKRKDRASLNLIEFINNGVEQNIFVASQYSY